VSVYVNNITNAAVTFRLADKTGTPIIWVGGGADFSGSRELESRPSVPRGGDVHQRDHGHRGHGLGAQPARRRMAVIMRRVWLLVLVLLAGSIPASAQVQVSSPIPVTDAATGSTGAALPGKAGYLGVQDSTANLSGLVQCDKTAFAAIATAANTQLVPLSGSTVIYVCSYVIEIQGIATTAGTNKLNYGTGTACATGTVQVTPDFVGSTTGGDILR
jgi:hypothetical protein